MSWNNKTLTYPSPMFNILPHVLAIFIHIHKYTCMYISLTKPFFYICFYLVIWLYQFYLSDYTREAWQAAAYGVPNCWTRLSNWMELIISIGSGFLTRDWTWLLAFGWQRLSHWTTREVHYWTIIKLTCRPYNIWLLTISSSSLKSNETFSSTTIRSLNIQKV